MAEDDLDRLVIEQIPHLRRYARALVGHGDRADDLVQDCLERAWSRLGLWRRDGNMRAWLFTIMHNLNANAVRAAKRRPRHDSIDDAMPHASTPATQEDRLHLSALSNALRQLPEEQRAVVLLVEVLIYVFILWLVVKFVWSSVETNRPMQIGADFWPMWPILIMMPLAFGLMLLEMVRLLVADARAAFGSTFPGKNEK